MRRTTVTALLVCSALASGATAAVEVDSNTFGGLKTRAIGPAVMSGRIAALDADPGPPLTIWVGSASGGVWKSADGGVTFEPVFDDHIQSIGEVRIDPTDPQTVWVGTGESWTRNSVSVGDGVYKTEDGGESWKRMGLADSERIARIVIDPQEPDTVYVCATGHLWDANAERGVYKTEDGGESWKQILSVDDDTGCADLTMDPQDPEILYAAMWQFRRWPWFFESGGPGSGLYVSRDGGDSWKRSSEGLPKGDLGRIAVAVAPSRPNVVYATVEAKKTGLYRSEDLGRSWERISTSAAVQGRPFYFSRLVVAPDDYKRVYKPGTSLGVSLDGGRSFNSPFSGGGGGVHPDHHALWINPTNPKQMLLGTDGGLYVSEDYGRHWRFVKSLPISQFYRVSADMDFPYNVYGGLQDNGSWTGPSRKSGGIQNSHWENVGFGDGFHTYVDPTDDDYLYFEYQGGRLYRLRRSTGEIRDIRPYPREGEEELRFNWNTPIHLSVNEPGTVYFGAQYLFRSRDRGNSWERVSGDLTTDDPDKQRQRESGGLSIDNSTAENHCSIFTVSESPLDGDVVWAGTDDGRLHVTRDGGESWTEVTAAVPGLPANTWVSTVEAGHFDVGTAYVTFDGHRTGDMTPYVFRTRDFGATFEPIADGIEGYAHVVREDPVNPELLFVGTEFGLWLSLDGGAGWARFAGNLPRVSVRDLTIHPREGDLVIATHGRGIHILDDLTPLRRLTAEALQADVALLDARPAVMQIPASLQSFSGQDEYVGPTLPEAAVITYYLKKRHIFGDLKIEILDADGETITTLPGTKRRGINRVVWPMRLKPPKVPPANALAMAFIGPRVAEGSYRVRLTKGKQVLDGSVTLVADPRSTHSVEDRAFQQRTSMELYAMLERLTFVVDSLIALREGAEQRGEGLKERDRTRRELTAFIERLEQFRASLVATSEGGFLSGEEQLRERIADLYSGVVGYEGRPTDSQLGRMARLGARLEEAEQTLTVIRGRELDKLNATLARRKLKPLEAPTRESWEAEQQGSAGAAAFVRDEALWVWGPGGPLRLD